MKIQNANLEMTHHVIQVVILILSLSVNVVRQLSEHSDREGNYFNRM